MSSGFGAKSDLSPPQDNYQVDERFAKHPRYLSNFSNNRCGALWKDEIKGCSAKPALALLVLKPSLGKEFGWKLREFVNKHIA